MSSRVFTRPRRTKVYDANYYAAENAYKSALDGLDRKYGGRSSAPPEPTANGGLSALGALRASLERERERPQPRRPVATDDEEIDIPRRKVNTAALLDEFDEMFENRKKTIGKKEVQGSSRTLKALDDQMDEDFAESMKRVRASRAARGAAEDLEELDSHLSSRAKKEVRSKLNFSSKMIDSVGVNEESISSGRKKVLSIKAAPTGDEDLTRWTAIKSGRRHVLDDEEESGSQTAAATRALQSRARLQDIENEMAELEERSAYREKRIKDLRALLNENETNSKETLHSTIRVKSTVTEKKVVRE